MSKTVGIVARDRRLRNFFTTKMQSAGVRVFESDTAIDAFNWAKDRSIQALVLDLHLEDTHGDDVCKEIKSQDYNPKLPILLLIEEDDEWFRVRCENAKADVIMPYNRAQEAVEKLKQLLFAEVRISTPGALEYYFVESSDKSIHKGKIVDVSVEGLAFRAETCDLERDMSVDIRLRLPKLEPIVGRATCVRVRTPDTDGLYLIGLRWNAYRKGDRERLANWIDSQI